MSFVVAKTCTGLPRINGIMKNITANIGEKVSSSCQCLNRGGSVDLPGQCAGMISHLLLTQWRHLSCPRLPPWSCKKCDCGIITCYKMSWVGLNTLHTVLICNSEKSNIASINL